MQQFAANSCHAFQMPDLAIITIDQEVAIIASIAPEKHQNHIGAGCRWRALPCFIYQNDKTLHLNPSR